MTVIKRTSKKLKSEPPTPEEFLARYPVEIQRTSDALRELVRQAVPDRIEKVILGWALIGFRVPVGKSDKHFAFLSPKPEAVYFGFEYGILIDDPDHLMDGEELKLKQVRFFTIRRQQDIHTEEVLHWTKEAADLVAMPRDMRLALLQDRAGW